jgi:hypothetical protein
MSFRRLVDTAKLRWRIELDCQELKQEFALSRFERRGWVASITTPLALGEELKPALVLPSPPINALAH